MNNFTIEYMTISEYVFSTKERAIEYYGSKLSFENALKANILTEVILDEDREIGEKAMKSAGLI